MNENDLPIFRTRDTFSNMRKDRFVIPQPTTLFVCKQYVLNKESQKRTVDKLVDRTPNWLELSLQEQTEEIKAALVLQTVAEYLYAKNMIQKDCTMFENGFDKDGNVILDAFYVKDTKTKKKWEDAFTKKETQIKSEPTQATIYPFTKRTGKDDSLGK